MVYKNNKVLEESLGKDLTDPYKVAAWLYTAFWMLHFKK